MFIVCVVPEAREVPKGLFRGGFYVVGLGDHTRILDTREEDKLVTNLGFDQVRGSWLWIRMGQFMALGYVWRHVGLVGGHVIDSILVCYMTMSSLLVAKLVNSSPLFLNL